MLGDFITRLLILVLGYAYPAFECFKTVEKNRVEIEELRFWCQYWILVAFLTVFERIGDIFISWLPMYGELKLTLLIYLWYPQTKGTGYVYDTLLRPYMTRHETVLDRKMQELRARAWDFALYYWQNCTELGETKFFEMLQYLAGQSSRLKQGNQVAEGEHNLLKFEKKKQPSISQQYHFFNIKTSHEKCLSNSGSSKKSDQQTPGSPPPPPNGFRSQSGKSKNWTSKTINRSIVESPTSKLVQFEPDSQSEYDQSGDSSIPESPRNSKLQQVHLKLRRTKPHN